MKNQYDFIEKSKFLSIIIEIPLEREGKSGKTRNRPGATGVVGGSALKRFLREQKLRVANKWHTMFYGEKYHKVT